MRVGLLDIAAAGVTLFALLLPAPTRPVTSAMPGPELTYAVAEAQADVIAHPESGAAARRLVERLIDANQSDGALRAASAAVARQADAPDRWRSLVAVSEAHMERLEVKPAHDWAEKAVAACAAPGASCPAHDRVRLDMYAMALQAGLDSGIDPRVDPRGFNMAIKSKIPTIHVSPGRKR